MQGNETERRREPRRKGERSAAPQPVADELRDDGGDEDGLDIPGTTPSFLTAQELQAWDPAKNVERRAPKGERRRIVMSDKEDE